MKRKMCYTLGRGLIVSLLLCTATLAGGWQLNPQPKHRLPYGHPPVHSYGRYGHPVIIIIQQPKSSKSSGYYSRGYSGLGRIYYPHDFKSQKGSRYTSPYRR